jgi:hypothetical protein
MAELVKGPMTVQYKASTMNTVRALWRKGALHYSWSGSMIGLSADSQEAATAIWASDHGQHVRRCKWKHALAHLAHWGNHFDMRTIESFTKPIGDKRGRLQRAFHGVDALDLSPSDFEA